MITPEYCKRKLMLWSIKKCINLKMEDLGREQGINFTRKKVIEQYSGFPEGKRLSYTKANETEFIINHVRENPFR